MLSRRLTEFRQTEMKNCRFQDRRKRLPSICCRWGLLCIHPDVSTHLLGNIRGNRFPSKAGLYYGCERYPDCDFMTWDTPVPTKCEKCGSTLFRKGSKLYCAKEGCGFEMPVPKKD